MIVPSYQGILVPGAAGAGEITLEDVSLTNTFAGSSSSKTRDVDITSNTDMVVCCIGMYKTGGPSISACTFNGVAMTLGHSYAQGNFGAYLYYMLKASLPGAGTYSISITPGSSGIYGGFWGYAFIGTEQAAPEDTGEGYSSTAVSSWSNEIVPATANAWIMDVNCAYDRTFTPDTGQTERADFKDGGTAGVCGGTEEIATPGTEYMGWTPSTSTAYIQAIMAIAPA